jgi:hypothetical protein
VALGLLEHARRGEDRGQPDGHVEEEPNPPGERLGQRAAEDQADARPDAGQRAVGGHRPGALWTFWEARGQERERRRREDRGADPLHGARSDHPYRGLSEPDRQ